MCSLALERLGEDAKHDGRRRELTALRCQLEARTKCPITGMPVELLLMVFDLVCRPVTVSLVCRRWREIALSPSHALALVGACRIVEESASQVAGVAQTIPRAGSEAHYPKVARRYRLDTTG